MNVELFLNGVITSSYSCSGYIICLWIIYIYQQYSKLGTSNLLLNPLKIHIFYLIIAKLASLDIQQNYRKNYIIKINCICPDNNLISEYTMGFLKIKSTTDVLTIFTNSVYECFDKQVPVYAVFFDIVSCYDSVHYDILLFRLKQYYGIKGRI